MEIDKRKPILEWSISIGWDGSFRGNQEGGWLRKAAEERGWNSDDGDQGRPHWEGDVRAEKERRWGGDLGGAWRAPQGEAAQAAEEAEGELLDTSRKIKGPERLKQRQSWGEWWEPSLTNHKVTEPLTLWPPETTGALAASSQCHMFYDVCAMCQLSKISKL